MPNEANIEGSFNNVLQDVHNSTINIAQILGKSMQYQDLLAQLNDKQELFNLQPEENTERRLQLSGEINQLKNIIEQFKKDVLALAETFNKIEINTDRLIRAKEFFDQGDIGEARAVLETELEQMQDEQAHLLREKEHFEQDILPALINNSEEFLLLAMATQTAYENPNRFEDTRQHFENSIKSYVTKENLFQYAYFLHVYNQFPEAINYYVQILNKFANELSLEEKATILNNLALLHFNENEYEKASDKFEEALKIDRNLAKDNPQTFLSSIAMTLNNLANLHNYQNEHKKASDEFEEALKIYQNLAKDNPQTFLHDVATILNNLAILHSNQNELEKAANEFEKTLEIRRTLAENNPQIHLPKVAMSLNNLGELHRRQNKYEKALDEIEEALKIYKDLAKDNPQIFLPNVANTLNNLALLHYNQNNHKKALDNYQKSLEIRQKLSESNPQFYKIDIAQTNFNLALLYRNVLPDREKSIQHALETAVILLEIADVVIYTQQYLEGAINILRYWNINDEEIERLIEEKMKETGENIN